MIYCASPGSFANLKQLEWLLDECIEQHIFCALVCTNKWSGFKEQRDAVIKDFQQILGKKQEKTGDENGVTYFGNVGLCTSVNSIPIKDEETGRDFEESGINELMYGIMKSLDEEKVAQCIEDEIINVLRPQDDDIKYQVVTDLLSNGRQALHQYQEELIPKIYKKEINTADGQLLQLLKQYFDRQWHSQYDSVNQWFTSFITTYQNDKNPQQYERVLTRTAEHGNRYMKDCPVLSIVLQLLFELIDDECLLQNTTIFDDLWSTVTNEGLKSIGKYSNYMKEEVLNEEVDKHRSTLYRALCEYYRPRLVAVLKEHHIDEEEIDHDVALDRIAENGVKKGIDLIQQEIVTRKQKQVLSENLHSNEQTNRKTISANAHLTVTKSNVVEVEEPTSATIIKVYVKRTGEIIYVPMKLVSTVRDVIKYVCEKSICNAKMDYNNYYLISSKNDQMLYDDQILDEMSIRCEESFEFKLCVKAAMRQQIITLALTKLNISRNEDVSNLQTPVDKTENSNEPIYSTVQKKLSKMSEVDASPDSVPNSVSSISRLALSKKTNSDLLQKEDLANSYRQLQKRVEEISEQLIVDPILRQKMFDKLGEINVVVCGSPRVGKSALINAICQQNLAGTHAGLHSCTNTMSCYYMKGNIEIGDETIDYQYNFWDTPGFENWDRAAIRTSMKHIKKKPKSTITCMIYCASPGSFANLEQLEWVLDECIKEHIFCALVCTNKWSGFKEQRNAIIADFHQILEKYHEKTEYKNGVTYFGNVGLCTSVNSIPIKDEETGKEFEESGIEELIFGIMESLDDEKVAQWCMVAFENKSFWKKLSDYPAQLKNFLIKFFQGAATNETNDS
ncbi:hypothetical protein I4U23_004739 [Adineta vaga]|nr:hypothetical protein I4U23_004739 [Adineta vaga]